MKLGSLSSSLIQRISNNSVWEWTESSFDSFANDHGLVKTNNGTESRINYISSESGIDIDLYISDTLIEWIDVAIDVILDPQTSLVREYNANVQSLQVKFQESLSQIEGEIGAAQLRTSSCPSETINFYCAIEIAVWNFNNSVVILKLEHQDPDVPLILDLIIKPNE